MSVYPLARTPQRAENQNLIPLDSLRSEASTCSMKTLMTSAEVATFLAVSEPTLSRWRSSKSGPPFIDLNGIPRYRDEDVDAWLKEKRA